MMNQLKAAYTQYKLVKILAFAGLLLGAALVSRLSGGFPPWAWRFMAHVLPQLPGLWASQGSNILAPLLGLALLSASLLIIWSIICILAGKIIIHFWHDYHAHQHFEMDLREAERIAEQTIAAGVGNDRRKGGSHDKPGTSAKDQARPYEQSGDDDWWPPRQALTATQPAPRIDQVATVPQMPAAYAVTRGSRVVGGENIGTFPLGEAAPTYPPPRISQRTERRVHIPTGHLVQEDNRASSRAAMRPQLRLVRSKEDSGSDNLESLESLESAPSRPTNTVSLGGREQDIAQRDTIPGRDEKEDDNVNISTQITRPARENSYDTLPYTEPLVPEEPLRLVVGIGLDAGIVRKNDPNEDNLFAIQGTRITKNGPVPVGLFVVADGMGGHANGQEASRLAIHALSDVIVPALLHNMSGIGSLSNPDNTNGQSAEAIFRDLLREGVYRANHAIYRRNRERPHMMGTTLTAALVVNTTAYVVNVGDSRTYHYHMPDGLKQITRDHSHVAQLVEDGYITRDEMYTHPRRNQIYRALGERSTVEVDNFIVSLQANDILLLCSDGLWEMVRDNDMQQIITSSARHPAQISSMLVQAALSRGGADNISVVVVGVTKTPAV